MSEENADAILMSEYRNCNESYEKQNGKDEEQNRKPLFKSEPASPMQDINKALEECKFGRFQVRLLFTTFVGIMSTTQINSSTSFLMPFAECDLDMNLKRKGLLTAIPYVGMCISSVVSGFLVDTFGRVIFLRIGYGGLFIFNLLSASSQTFEMIVISKLFEGFMGAIAISGISSLTSEFCHPSVRDRVMLCQSSFGAISLILSPAMAWSMLLHNWEFSLFSGYFVLKIWNIYLFAMSTWALAAYILYSTLPESPKFLVTRKKYLKARNILIEVYKENNRNAETFSYPNLWDQEIKEEAMKKVVEKYTLKKFKVQVLAGMHNMKPLLHRPLLGYLFIIGFMQLAVVGMHNVLRLWFPQLSTIVEHYKLDGSQNLCVALDNFTANEKHMISSSTLDITHECKPHHSGTETYVYSMIIGVISVVPYFISGVIVNKVGKKFLMIITGIIATGALLGIRWSSSKIMMVAFYSTDIALTQTMKSLSQVVLVEVFPTTMRSLAMALVMCWARVGTLAGNILFPILLQQACEIPFYSMTGIMISVIVLSIFMPKKTES